MAPIRFTVPVRIDSALSLNGRLHWAKRKRRTDGVRLAVRCCFGREHFRDLAALRPAPKVTALVTLTRCAPRLMDDDNSVSALKSVRDEVAARLGIDDGDARIRWVYAQRVGPWAVEVLIEEVHP